MMVSMGRSSNYTPTPPPPSVDRQRQPLDVVSPEVAQRLGAPPKLPVLVIQNDAVYSLKVAVDTEEDARTASRFLVRSTDLDRFTLRIVRAHGFSTDPFPVFLYVRSLGGWTRRCSARIQVETTTHFVMECVSCTCAEGKHTHK